MIKRIILFHYIWFTQYAKVDQLTCNCLCGLNNNKNDDNDDDDGDDDDDDDDGDDDDDDDDDDEDDDTNSNNNDNNKTITMLLIMKRLRKLLIYISSRQFYGNVSTLNVRINWRIKSVSGMTENVA